MTFSTYIFILLLPLCSMPEMKKNHKKMFSSSFYGRLFGEDFRIFGRLSWAVCLFFGNLIFIDLMVTLDVLFGKPYQGKNLKKFKKIFLEGVFWHIPGYALNHTKIVKRFAHKWRPLLNLISLTNFCSSLSHTALKNRGSS